MRIPACFGVEKGGDAGIRRADECLGGDTLGCAALTLGEEIKEQPVEWAGRRNVADGRRVGVVISFSGLVSVGDVRGVGSQLSVAGYRGLCSPAVRVLSGIEQEAEI